MPQCVYFLISLRPSLIEFSCCYLLMLHSPSCTFRIKFFKNSPLPSDSVVVLSIDCHNNSARSIQFHLYNNSWPTILQTLQSFRYFRWNSPLWPRSDQPGTHSKSNCEPTTTSYEGTTLSTE